MTFSASPSAGTLSVCVLASGSKGNCVFISSGRTCILIDAGLSGKQIQHRLASAGIDARSLDAIVVSHEHSDHIRGVGIMARRFNLPVYINPKTARAAAGQLGRIDALHLFDCGKQFCINDLQIHPFSTSHDASDPAGFTIARNGCKIGIATDLGVATTMVQHHLKGCRALVLEANHDPKMLAEGPYPWPLKQRIKSRDGHLSNQDSLALLQEVRHEHLEHVILAHLSETNNTPELALDTIQAGLNASGQEPICLHVAEQDTCSQVVVLT